MRLSAAMRISLGLTGLTMCVLLAAHGLGALLVGMCAFITYCIYIKRSLQQLDPGNVIPERVKMMLNTLGEGVLVLDNQERIVLANEAFAATLGKPASELLGTRASTLTWSAPQNAGMLPWQKTLQTGHTQTDVRLSLQRPHDSRTFRVNCAPLLGADGSRSGVLASFTDITTVEEKTARLRQMLDMLQASRAEINRQNAELQALALTDPLTGCMNRRSFFAEFDKAWSSAKRYGHPLACVMVDVDFFKSINDRHGHAVGDQVLRHVAHVLKQLARDTDLVCRYGGEEFCILLPHIDLQGALQAAERYRAAIESSPCVGISITASLGCSAIALKARDPQDMLEQADRALRYSKRAGRNRSTSFDRVPPNMDAHDESPVADHHERNVPIPFHAVTALMSALAHRDAATADHCQRVADLCVATAKGLMSVHDSFNLEVAAMLHDIGKLGVPDAILLKPGPLTHEEWMVMRTHDQMGVEIIAAAFGSKELTEIVRTHHAWFAGNPENLGLPVGQDIPLGARILTIADAYDAMVSERPYHRPKPQDQACAELRRCAGKQFDPDLVEKLIKTVSERDASRVKPAMSVPQQTALRIRLEIERLACALDERDLSMLGAMAQHIAAVANKDGLGDIAGVATTLEHSVNGDADLESVLKLTNELLELCRSPQSLKLDQPQSASTSFPNDV